MVDGEPNFACPAPVPVTGLVASISADNRVDLASDDAGAESYNVYRSRLSGGPFEPIGSTDEPSFTYPDVSGGATYFYVVRAAGCGESANSNEARPPPPAPAENRRSSTASSR